jgi:hypothetical protein
MKRIIFILLLSSAAVAQDNYNDAQLRTHLSVEKKINKHFSAELREQNRFNMNMTNFYRASADAGLIWNINKHIRFRADYVFIEKKNKNDLFLIHNWYYGALILKGGIHRWKFFYRNKFQVRKGAMNTDEAPVAKMYDRSMVMVKYELTKRFTMYVAEEVYSPVNSPGIKGIDRSRSYIGTEIKTTRNQQLELYFMYQAKFYDPWFSQKKNYPGQPPKHDFVYGISYSFNI